MVTGFEGPHHLPGVKRGRRLWRTVLLQLAAGSGVILALLAVVVFLVLPALARRGDLNSLVKETIRSTLSVPISIGGVETEPLSEFSITRVTTLAASAEDR